LGIFLEFRWHSRVLAYQRQYSTQQNWPTAVTSAKKSAGAAYLDFAHGLADVSAAAILPFFRRPLEVENKGGAKGFDPVTAADRAAERAMRRAIAGRFPDHGIFGEELGMAPGKGRHRWVLDPIDGTRAFIMGSPLWGTLIGLVDGDKPVVGLMNQPFTRERFWSDARVSRTSGPDGKIRRLKTRACADLRNAVLTTTHPELLAGPDENAAFAQLRARARMTRYGGDCYGYCLVAAGFVDLVVEAGLKPFDIIALVPIIEAAGGIVTTWEGESPMSGGRIIAAGDARIHRQALAILKSARQKPT
jgi:histidinol phosphatase-like enzyme (inositol monophosphatase family)